MLFRTFVENFGKNEGQNTYFRGQGRIKGGRRRSGQKPVGRCAAHRPDALRLSQPDNKGHFREHVRQNLRGFGRSSGRPEAAHLRSGYSGVVRHCGRPPWNYPRKGRDNKTASGGDRKTSIPVAILKKNINELNLIRRGESNPSKNPFRL